MNENKRQIYSIRIIIIKLIIINNYINNYLKYKNLLWFQVVLQNTSLAPNNQGCIDLNVDRLLDLSQHLNSFCFGICYKIKKK